MIAGDDHLRRHQDKKIGNFLLQLQVLQDFDGSGRKTCKNDDDDDDEDDDEGANGQEHEGNHILRLIGLHTDVITTFWGGITNPRCE